MEDDPVNLEAPNILKRLNNYVNLNEQGNDEALIYALAQLLYDRIEAVDMIDEEKGKLVSDLIVNFGEMNKVQLAAHKELMLIFMESKDTTVH
jgi:hypothetical protein